MRRKILVAQKAAIGLRRARSWLCQPGAGPDGISRWENLRKTRRSLRDHPFLGTINPADPSFRQLVVSGYRIVYQIDESTGDVLIAAVFGPGEP